MKGWRAKFRAQKIINATIQKQPLRLRDNLGHLCTVKSSIVSGNQKTKNRRDHYLPQAYLRGFIDPARAHLPKPLRCFHPQIRKWKERSPKQIGYIDGFYDYAIENTDAELPQHALRAPPANRTEQPSVKDCAFTLSRKNCPPSVREQSP